MLKKWYESRPALFGWVFIFFYITIPIMDQIYVTPMMKPQCNGQITDQQARACTNWIRKKEKGHVRTTQRGLGGLRGNPSSDRYLREQERAITDFGGK